ncbi:MAG TPA: type II CRISPR-associated endonuclease Cas1 [Phycisphaerae bacterium]|nr:type II CRISPR-associated endonuclease Cas1 [Phycisphaerae bacterium]
MTDRMIDISQEQASLKVRMGQLVVTTDNGETTVPIVDIGALVVSHPRVTYTQAVLNELAVAGGVFIICDERYLPSAMLLPLQTHHVQTQNFAQQAAAKEPVKKRVWQQIIRAKIKGQADVLKKITGDYCGLDALIPQVHSGDSTNRESVAARKYWPALFGQSFRRDFDALDQNRHLNYGYAILRGIVARGICAAGLHPSIGLNHHHRNNPFCLADDLMEPFRPIVDTTVCEYVRSNDFNEFGREAKINLLETLSADYNYFGENRTLFDISAHVAASLAAVFRGENKKLDLPNLGI